MKSCQGVPISISEWTARYKKSNSIDIIWVRKRHIEEEDHMDINNLSQTDINELIQAEKNPKNVMEYQDIVNQVTQQLIH